MLPREARLTASRDFQAVFQGGKPIFLGEALLLTRPVPGQPTQIGVAFQGKRFPTIVQKHAYKRRLLAALQPHLAGLPSGFHAVILFQKPFFEESYERFIRLAEKVVQNLHKLNTSL